MPGRRPLLVLPFAYLIGLSLLAGVLALVGAAVDRTPLVPDAAGRVYGAGAVTLVATLTAPLDAWAPRSGGPDPGARPPTRPDPGPDTTD